MSWRIGVLLLVACGPDSMIGDAMAVTPACAALEDGVWESAPWPPENDGGMCAWLRYGGLTTLEVQHDLPVVPRSIEVYVAFEASGVGATLASGDVARIEAVTETAVTISNGTEQDFFVKLVLR